MRTLPISSALSALRESLSPSRMGVICGGQAWSLGVRVAAQMACEHKQSLYLCGDNRFDLSFVTMHAESLAGLRIDMTQMSRDAGPASAR